MSPLRDLEPRKVDAFNRPQIPNVEFTITFFEKLGRRFEGRAVTVAVAAPTIKNVCGGGPS
eukprot:TRINITY_DN12348_c0_g1_i1.p3 TRINITY_DN12348_c0_g1~~TRINITY_DN12348_c0_g1_i1.p3  ORF type:complete len:61 (+),score=9.66 TRINITY_DN12348_c0_g1_i1:173-355(+)